GHTRSDAPEIARDAACKPAEGLHILRLTKLFLKSDLTGDVGQGAFVIEDVAIFIANHARIFSDRDDAVIAGSELELDVGVTAIALQSFAQSDVEVGIDKGIAHNAGDAEFFLARKIQHSQQLGIRREDSSVRRRLIDAFENVFK